MAFVLADPTTLARDKWPDHLARIGQEKDVTCDTLAAARMVPHDDEDLTEWLWVDHQPEMSRALVYIRQDVAGAEDANVEVVVRFQGVIADMNLNVGGNWDGLEMNAKKATQYITLISGGCNEAFEPQMRAAAALREVILLQLGVNVDPRASRPGSLVLRRRVFTKIRVGANDHLPSIVKKAEDPRSKFADIRSQWRVTERVIAATHLAHGAIFPIPPLAIRRGDFVDVSARVTVTIMRNSNGRYYEVAFEPTTIVRLADAQKTRRILQPKPRVPIAVEIVAVKEVRKTMAIGFAIEKAGVDVDGERDSEDGEGTGAGAEDDGMQCDEK